MKGPKWREELDAAGEILANCPFRLKQVIDHQLPFSGARRSLLLFDNHPTEKYNVTKVNE
jgi:hypothetical protein